MSIFMPNVVIGNRLPSWQPEEDRIVGNMLRQLLSFEGKHLTKDTLRDMETIVEYAVREAEDIGARGHYVRSIGQQRLFVNGRSFEAQKDFIENVCSQCGNRTRFGCR